MALSENIAQLTDTNPTKLLMQGGEAVTINDSDWCIRFSDSDRYKSEDRFDEDVYTSIKQRLVKIKFSIKIGMAFSGIFVFAFFISLGFFIFDRDATYLQLLMGSGPKAVIFLIENLLNHRNSYLFSALFFMFIAFLSSTTLSVKIWEASKEYLRSIEQLRTLTHGLRQIYPGGGTLQFCHGKKGIRVFNNTVDLRINWHAVDDAEGLLPYFLLRREFGTGKRKSMGLTIPAKAEDATHLLVFLKSNDVHEYLVIPKRFFEERKNASRWLDFADDMKALKKQYEDSKKPIPPAT